MNLVKRILVVIFSIGLYSATAAVIPTPLHLVKKSADESFVFDASTKWILPADATEQLWSVVEPLSNSFERVSGYNYTPSSKRAKRNFVEVKINPDLSREEYKMDVCGESILIEAATHNGLFYALQTIRQLLPSQIERAERVDNITWSIPTLEVADRPAVEYRGFMIDVARHFIPKDNLLEIIDVLGMLKINTLQLHLVDDNGWRIEIKQYPKLTEIGSCRVERKEYFSARLGAAPGEPTVSGGFYTQDDIREIVAYAAQRAIEVIPEIEMPAHTMSSLAAYPEMACSSQGEFIGVVPGLVGYNNYTPTYCAGKPEVYTFLQNILFEVMELFPSKYIHVGGDEAPTQYWAECKHCQAVMEREGYDDPHMMQSYFMKQMGQFLSDQGKVLVGWDELVDSPMPDNAMIVGWRGDGRSAFKAAELGHKFVMAPAQKLYFIRYQGPQWFEPKTYFGNITLKDVYEFQHLPEGVSQKIRSNFLGTQACLWSEFCECVEDAQYLIFPRLMAHSENAWAPQSALNWESFVERLDAVLEHLEVKGVQYARSMYNLDHKVTSAEGGGLAVNISCIRPDVEIRYTLKGAAPRSHDAQWSGEMIFDESTTIAAATFKDGKQMGQTLILPIAYNKATAKPVTAIGANAADAEVALLVNGVRGSDKPSDFEWCRWYRDDAGFIVDMQRVESISRVTLGAIMDHTLAVGMAKRIVVSASLDGEHYTALAEKNLTDEECFEQVIKTYDLLFAGLDTEARYLKVEFENPGKILEELPRAGQDCYVYFDEIIIE